MCNFPSELERVFGNTFQIAIWSKEKQTKHALSPNGYGTTAKVTVMQVQYRKE